MGGEVLNLYKQLGETPRERLERLRIQRPEYSHEVLSYAGRLDPMAEGVMLCLVGATNKRREMYLDMSKTYVLDVLFGFSTDTYDILGRVMEKGESAGLRRPQVEKALNEFRGAVSQEYPPFSSKTVEGKSLIEWARAGAINAMVLPRRTITIYDINLTSMYKVGEPTLLGYIEHTVGQVEGDFRQDEIMRLWKRALRKEGAREFVCATIEVSCSSGTYVRSIAHGLGAELGTPALALHILRTKVGEYEVERAMK